MKRLNVVKAKLKLVVKRGNTEEKLRSNEIKEKVGLSFYKLAFLKVLNENYKFNKLQLRYKNKVFYEMYPFEDFELELSTSDYSDILDYGVLHLASLMDKQCLPILDDFHTGLINDVETLFDKLINFKVSNISKYRDCIIGKTFCVPYEFNLDRQVKGNLFMNTGDGNFDFTLNNLLLKAYCDNIYLNLPKDKKEHIKCIKVLLSLANEDGISNKEIVERIKNRKAEFNVNSVLFEIRLLNYDMEDIVDTLREAGFKAEIRKDYYNEMFTDSREDVENNSSLVWLVKQQGYTFKQLEDAIINQNFYGSEFLKSVYNECANVTTSINLLGFFFNTTLADILEFNNDEFKDKNTVTISKDATCGLFDWSNGAGSLMKIKLEKDVVIPKELVARFTIEGCSKGYNIDDVYRPQADFWKGKLTLKKAPTRE